MTAQPVANSIAAACIVNLSFAADRALTRIAEPFRAARYRRRTAPFLHRGRRGFLFELYPNEEVDRHIATYGIYERRPLEYLETLIPRGAVMLDVGANIGNHAIYLAPKCSEVHCFEPNPRAYRRLERNVALNKIRNITIHRFGLGDRDTVARFRDDGWLGCARFDEQGDQELHIRKGDDAVPEVDRIDFIKIDVEGMDASVISGFAKTIARHRPIVTFEYSGHAVPPSDWNQIVEALPGYTIVEPRFTLGIKGLRFAGRPKLKEIKQPERRCYFCLIAFPSALTDVEIMGRGEPSCVEALAR